MKVDVHILRVPNENEEWFQYCLESMEREPVNIHVLDGVVGHIGKGRQAGLQIGTEPYVAWVDPDDLVCRGAFQACIDALEADPSKVLAYTREAYISEEGGCLIGELDKKLYEPFFGTRDEALRAHHLTVYRRAALPDLVFLDDWPFLTGQALRDKMWNNNFAFVDRVGYQWRRRPDSGSKQNYKRTPEMQALLKRQDDLWRKIV